jgi:3(or 17)beta-hydroxysteroid dehydrogenase
MTQQLDGKIALITGGTSGIGAGTVRRLTAEGARVIFTGSNAAAAETICAETGAQFYPQRVQEPTSWAPLMEEIRTKYGRLDIAFANAGMEAGDGSIESITFEGWQGVLDDNPGGATGSIIINSSMNAHRAMGNFMAYSVTKAAVVALTKSVAVHCGNQGYKIRCNAILPGVVETAMITNLINGAPDPAAARGAYEGMSPLKRMANVDEIAKLVAFLASDDAAFISGSEYVIDGATTAGMMGV